MSKEIGDQAPRHTEEQLVGIFVVCAHRWGLRDAHSYVVGAYLSKDDAQRVANEHVAYRGGKYGCEVVLCGGPASEEGNAHEQVHYAETPYYGAAGRGSPSCEPADRKKPLWEDDANTGLTGQDTSAGPGTVKCPCWRSE